MEEEFRSRADAKDGVLLMELSEFARKTMECPIENAPLLALPELGAV